MDSWVILDEQLGKCVRELEEVFDKYDFPLVVQVGILESLKQHAYGNIEDDEDENV